MEILESDTPAVAGALAVRFYQREVENAYKTTQEGRPITYMADFVRIEIPGNLLSVIDTFVNEQHKRDYPLQWAQYVFEKERGAPSDVQGTMLRDWPLLTAAQATEMRGLKFYTVEQIAASSDQQIAAVGMLVGMSPFALREKARAFLRSAKDSGFAQQQAEEIKKRDLQIADLSAMVERLADTVQELKKERDAPAESNVDGDVGQSAKRGPGRPRKDA